MSPVEAIFVWLAIGTLGISSGLFFYIFIFKNDRFLKYLVFLIGAVVVFLTFAILARYRAIGNLPTAGSYENAVGIVWFVTVFTFYVTLRHKHLRVIGVATLPMSLIMLGYGVMTKPELIPAAASLKSFWLYIHVFFAWLAFGAYAIAFGLGILYLLKNKNPEKEFYVKLPSLPRMDDLMFKYVIFGFITDAVMIASGAIWAKDLWGNYWNWDPVEVWSLITWLIYGLSIHLKVTMGWNGRKLAWIVIFALTGMIITYFGIDLFVSSSLHLFSAWQTM